MQQPPVFLWGTFISSFFFFFFSFSPLFLIYGIVYGHSFSLYLNCADAIDEVLRLLDESTLTAALEKANSLISSVKSNAHSSTIRMTVAMLETTLKSAQDQQPEERKEKVDRIITLLHQLREQFVVRNLE